MKVFDHYLRKAVHALVLCPIARGNPYYLIRKQPLIKQTHFFILNGKSHHGNSNARRHRNQLERLLMDKTRRECDR